MSDLYKEIDGKIGIVEIYKMMWILPYPKDFKIEDDRLLFGNHTFEWLFEFNGFSLDGEAAHLQLEVINYLDEHHYDWRYDLIDQNLAINKTV